MDKYRVIIVGAGPAGIFAGLQLLSRGVDDILMLEKGPDLQHRRCPSREEGASCLLCRTCHLLSGWGGAGAFSDGKLTLSTRIGGHLTDYLPADDLEALIEQVDGIFLDHGAPAEIHGPGPDELAHWKERSERAGLSLVPSPIRHMGTDGARVVMSRIRDCLAGKIDIRFDQRAARILSEGSRVTGVETETGEVFKARFVLLAPGRAGLEWLTEEGRKMGLNSVNNPVDIGVRVEVPDVVMKPLTDALYEAKLYYTSSVFKDLVRTFCMCPHGEVVTETIDGVQMVNGQSYKARQTDNTNFALLVSTSFTKPFKDPVAYGRYIAGLANLLSGGVLVQRLGDLEAGRRSNPDRMRSNPVRPTLPGATPGDLSFALPYRHLSDIREMIAALERLVPGVGRPETLLYGVEAKFYSIRLKLTRELETEVENLFAAGDGAGVSRGLVQAASSGLMAGEAISRRIEGLS